MATLNYFLKETSQGTKIYGEFHIGNNRFRFSTGLPISKKDWDQKRKLPKQTAPDYKKIRSYLNKLNDHFNQQFVKLKTDDEYGSIFGQKLQAELRGFGKVTKPDKAKSIIEIYDEYIEHQRLKLAKSTIVVYKTVRRSLNNFFIKNPKYKRVADLDLTFFEDYHNYLLKSMKMVGDDGQTITDNTIWKRLSNTRSFINWCKKRNIPVSNSYSDYKLKKRKTTRVFLEEKELHQIEQVELPSESLNKVRDVFLFSCYTGLRYGDLKSLSPSHIQDGRIVIEMEKSEKTVYIPINPKTIQILDKYSYLHPEKCLPVISDQKINKYVKEVARLAGLDKQVENVAYSGSQQIKKNGPKWNFVSMHTGRHTFATLALSNDVKIEALQKLLGHSSISQTMEYAKLVEGTLDKEMKKLTHLF